MPVARVAICFPPTASLEKVSPAFDFESRLQDFVRRRVEPTMRLGSVPILSVCGRPRPKRRGGRVAQQAASVPHFLHEELRPRPAEERRHGGVQCECRRKSRYRLQALSEPAQTSYTFNNFEISICQGEVPRTLARGANRRTRSVTHSKR